MSRPCCLACSPPNNNNNHHPESVHGVVTNSTDVDMSSTAKTTTTTTPYDNATMVPVVMTSRSVSGSTGRTNGHKQRQQQQRPPQQQQQQHQFACLYTSHKTQKRKVWSDGRLVILSNVTTASCSVCCRAILHPALLLPTALIIRGGCPEDWPPLDECELTTKQFQSLRVAAEDNSHAGSGTDTTDPVMLVMIGRVIEFEKFLVLVGGPWNSNNNNNPNVTTATTTTTTIAATRPVSSGMQKLLSQKYKRPPRMVPPPPPPPPPPIMLSISSVHHTTTTTPIASNNSIQQVRRPAIQPGELQRQYYPQYRHQSGYQRPRQSQRLSLPPQPNDSGWQQGGAVPTTVAAAATNNTTKPITGSLDSGNDRPADMFTPPPGHYHDHCGDKDERDETALQQQPPQQQKHVRTNLMDVPAANRKRTAASLFTPNLAFVGTDFYGEEDEEENDFAHESCSNPFGSSSSSSSTDNNNKEGAGFGSWSSLVGYDRQTFTGSGRLGIDRITKPNEVRKGGYDSHQAHNSATTAGAANEEESHLGGGGDDDDDDANVSRIDPPTSLGPSTTEELLALFGFDPPRSCANPLAAATDTATTTNTTASTERYDDGGTISTSSPDTNTPSIACASPTAAGTTTAMSAAPVVFNDDFELPVHDDSSSSGSSSQ